METKTDQQLAPGWHVDEDTGALMRDVIHRMGRRCRNWDYCGRGVYQITITLADRKSRALGRLRHDEEKGAYVELSAVGLLVEATLLEVPRQWPGVEIMSHQLMPDHLHFVVAVKTRQKRPLGAIVGSFKSKSTSRWLELLDRTRPSATGETRPSAMGATGEKTRPSAMGETGEKARPSAMGGAVGGETRPSAMGEAVGGETRPSAMGETGEKTRPSAMGETGETRPSAMGGAVGASARAPKLWSEGYVDNILFDEQAVANSLAYLADNPRRLWEKLAHPELFTVLRDLPVDIGGFTGHFAAIGNHNLLKAHSILQIQCSRRFFAYARDADGRLLKNAPPRVITPEFRECCEALLEEAANGSVLISPCISEGEREIARRAFIAGHRVITLANKGFSPLYKPSGKLFDTCAAGSLLMLAPAAWPYLPGEKKMTRLDACVLNRLAQLIAGPGAVEIVYKGTKPGQVDNLARDSVSALAGVHFPCDTSSTNTLRSASR